jgi:AcrR family transcriptional regulator
MAKSPTAPDRYRRRREAGEASRAETQRRLVAAADQLFRERGYSATTVSAIAAAAGVSIQTVYLAWGSKRDLLRAAARAATVQSTFPTSPEQWRAMISADIAEQTGDDLTAHSYLKAVARLFTGVAERTAPYRNLNRQATAVEPEVAEDFTAMQAERRRTIEAVADGVPRDSRRPGLSDSDLRDTLWALASPEMYDLLTGAGRSRTEFEAWLSRTLIAALCA